MAAPAHPRTTPGTRQRRRRSTATHGPSWRCLACWRVRDTRSSWGSIAERVHTPPGPLPAAAAAATPLLALPARALCQRHAPYHSPNPALIPLWLASRRGLHRAGLLAVHPGGRPTQRGDTSRRAGILQPPVWHLWLPHGEPACAIYAILRRDASTDSEGRTHGCRQGVRTPHEAEEAWQQGRRPRSTRRLLSAPHGSTSQRWRQLGPRPPLPACLQGLTLCVVAGADLFTSNCMYATFAVAEGAAQGPSAPARLSVTQ